MSKNKRTKKISQKEKLRRLNQKDQATYLNNEFGDHRMSSLRNLNINYPISKFIQFLLDK